MQAGRAKGREEPAGSRRYRERLGCFAGGAFEEFMNQGLIGFGLFCGQAAQLSQETRSDADGYELLGVSGFRPADAPGTAKLLIR